MVRDGYDAKGITNFKGIENWTAAGLADVGDLLD